MIHEDTIKVKLLEQAFANATAAKPADVSESSDYFISMVFDYFGELVMKECGKVVDSVTGCTSEDIIKHFAETV